MKTWFFGWSNIKWFISEIGKIYSSSTSSFFSKKRIESGVAFVIAQWGMVYFLLNHHINITMGEFLLWAAAEFAVAGYIIGKIEQAKRASYSESQFEEKSEDQQINS